jgi:peptidoglycan L-alanyl-D-glutamate endopeptidase CwlK
MNLLARLRAFLAPRREAAGQPLAPPPAPLPIIVSTVGEVPQAPPLPAPYPLAPEPLPMVAHVEIPRAAMLTARDRKRLEGVHPDLIRVVERARRDVEFYVSEGVRTLERQREMIAQGVSKTMNSRHLTGHAVDLYPVSDVPVPAMTARDLAPVVSAIRRAAHAEGVPLIHGADWGWDHPHHELDRARYP